MGIDGEEPCSSFSWSVAPFLCGHVFELCSEPSSLNVTRSPGLLVRGTWRGPSPCDISRVLLMEHRRALPEVQRAPHPAGLFRQTVFLAEGASQGGADSRRGGKELRCPRRERPWGSSRIWLNSQRCCFSPRCCLVLSVSLLKP